MTIYHILFLIYSVYELFIYWREKMKIAIIGTGNMGSGLASLLVDAGYEVLIGHRDITKASTLASQLGAQCADINTVIKSAEVIILALPYQAAKDVLSSAGDLSGKVLIDIINPVSNDFKDLVIGHSTSAAEQIQSIVPTAKVVKAFNTIFAQLLPKSARKGHNLQVFIASDDDNAKRTVSQIAQSLGFEAVDSGALSNSRFIEPIGEMNIHFGFFLGKGPSVAPVWVTV